MKFKGLEAIFRCGRCLQKLSQYVSEDKPYFFDEAKKTFIQYYIPVGDTNREIIVSDASSFLNVEDLQETFFFSANIF